MKKITLILLFSLFLQQAYSQVWIDIAVKGGYGMSLLYNKNLLDDGAYNHHLTGAGGFGGRLGVNIGESNGFTLEVMSRKMKQDFDYTIAGQNFNTQVEWKNLDLYFLYRYNSNRVFMELGPMLSLVRSVDHTDDNPLAATILSVTGAESYSEFYNDKYISGVFGFGGFLVGTEVVSLNLFFRVHYAFQDFINDKGQNPEATGIIRSFPAPIREKTYDEYKSTNPIFGEVGMELAFGLGQFARSNCSTRMHFFWSGNR